MNKEVEEQLEQEMHRVTSMLGFLIEIPDDFMENAIIGKKMMARNVLRLACASFWMDEMIKRMSKKEPDFKEAFDGLKGILEVR